MLRNTYQTIMNVTSVGFRLEVISVWTLKIHIQLHHGGTRYPCDQCEYQTVYPDHLKAHKVCIHDSKGYAREQCGYETVAKINLKEH